MASRIDPIPRRGTLVGMSSRIFYAVTATLPDEATLCEYIAWLEGGHVEAVIKGGAHSVMIVRLEGEPVRIETQYIFSTRERFEQYEQKHAPALRADGMQRFGSGRGVSFERRVGEIV
ncbi:MAG: DUF4286 family protein [Phycisphaeraceae bacterium]|nr:MAG: DUF4286 family protein [Phycisphaeraceae bacterium]